MNAMPSNLWEFLMTFDADMRFPLVICAMIFGGTALVALVGIISHTIHTIHKNRLDDALKRELVDRGMTAGEIERIVRARSTEKTDSEENA